MLRQGGRWRGCEMPAGVACSSERAGSDRAESSDRYRPPQEKRVQFSAPKAAARSAGRGCTGRSARCASISRSSAFISSSVSWRLARTAPWQAIVDKKLVAARAAITLLRVVLRELGQHAARQLDRDRRRPARPGTERTRQRRGATAADDSEAERAQRRRPAASAVAISCGVAAKRGRDQQRLRLDARRRRGCAFSRS